MHRRKFLASSIAASTAGFGSVAELEAQQQPASAGREYYQLRKYCVRAGPQTKLTHTYLEKALVPALNRLGFSPVGVFDLYLGPETPVVYVLMPGSSIEALAMAEFGLAKDDAFVKAAQPFWNAPAKEPAFDRVDSDLFVAFEGYPKLTVPPPTAQKGKRVFQLRTYESPSNADHVRKVEMFNSGEYDIFKKAGFWSVFYGDALIGSHLPQLTYMLCFSDLSELVDKWKAFTTDPDWKKLTGSPRFSYESIVTNTTNLILNPADYSQI